MALSRITEAVASFTDLTIGDDLTLTDDLLLASDAALIKFGADADVIFTHVADTGLLLNSASVIQFRDSAINIGSPADGDLDINADDEIELNSTLIDVNGNLDVSGTIVGASTLSATTITASTAFVPDASDGAALGTTALEFSDLFLADAAVIALGADQDVTLTHVADTGVLLNAASVVQFRDSAINIGSPADGDLDINADDEIELNSTLIDVNGNLDVSGTIVGASTLSATTITASTAFVPDASDGAALGTTALEFSDLFLADAAVINLGADQDVTITHVADTGVLINGASVVQFRDSAINIGSPADGDLDINADDEIELNSTLIDINGNVEISGTAAITGIATFTDDIIIGDGKTIGSASDVDAITIASNGQLTLTQQLNGTIADFSGDITGSTLNADGDTAAGDNAAIGYTAAEGLILTGQGSTNDVTIKNDADTEVMGVATGATVVDFASGPTVADVAIKVAGKESIWVPAGAMYPSTTNPCSDLTQVETTALRPDLKVLDFATGADEFAQFSIAFPKSWNEGTVTFQPFWTVTGTNTGTVAWQLGGIAVSSDDTINTAFGTLVATTALAHSGTSNDLMVSVESGAVTIAGSPAAGDCCFFQINRDVSADNQSGDARLVGIKLHFTTDAGNDS